MNACVHNLHWSHYRALLSVVSDDARYWYVREASREGLPKPEVEVRGGTFYITIFRKARKVNPSSVLINDAINDAISDAINDAIKSRPGVKKVELVKIIGKSKPTIERAIALLKQQGRIEYRGSKKTGGYYAKG